MIAEMKMLLWKDYRLSRLILVAGVMLIVGPYLMLMFFPRYWEWHYNAAWAFTTFISQFTMAFLAGNIIVSERTDRSAEFLAFQGASRKMCIASKLIICFLVFALICCINIILSFWFTASRFERSEEVLIISIPTGVCFFGCCWLLSALLSSPVYAIVFGTIMPFLIIFALALSAYFFNWSEMEYLWIWYITICSGLGILSLLAGTWHFIRSKES